MHIDKREHIITHALELFAVKSFEGTSVRDIAEKAQVNVAMVNYYFGSKEKLFEAIVGFKAGLTRGVLEGVAKDKTKTEIEKIDMIVEIYVRRLFFQSVFHRVLYQELLMMQRETLHQHIADIFIKNTLIIKSIIEQGIRKKVFQKVDPELTVATMIGSITQVMLSRHMCNKLMNKNENFNPYEDEKFIKRVIKHIQQLMHNHLLIHRN